MTGRELIEAHEAFVRLTAAIYNAQDLRRTGASLPDSMADELIAAASAYLEADIRQADAEEN